MKIQDDVLDMVGTAKDLLVYIANHIDKAYKIKIVAPEVARALNTTERTVYRHINILEHKNILNKIDDQTYFVNRNIFENQPKPKPINITCQKDIDKETLLLLSNFAIKIQRIQTMGIDKKYGIDLQSFDYSNMNEDKANDILENIRQTIFNKIWSELDTSTKNEIEQACKPHTKFIQDKLRIELTLSKHHLDWINLYHGEILSTYEPTLNI